MIRIVHEAQAAVWSDIHRVAAEAQEVIADPEPVQEPEECRILREQAAQEAEAIRAEAERQAAYTQELAQQEGYRSGFQTGYQDGLRTGQHEIEQEREAFLADMAAFVARIQQAHQKLWEEAEPQILAFVLEIAQKVVKDDAQVNRQVALSTVRNALRRISAAGTDAHSIRIRVHLDDLQTVRASREDLMTLVDGIRGLEIIEDRRVTAGGCIIETPGSNIDARIETQFDELASLVEEEEDAA